MLFRSSQLANGGEEEAKADTTAAAKADTTAPCARTQFFKEEV